MPLSEYNKANVCFCHEEHPYAKPKYDHTPPVGAGHATPELNAVIKNEYGGDGFC